MDTDAHHQPHGVLLFQRRIHFEYSNVSELGIGLPRVDCCMFAENRAKPSDGPMGGVGFEVFSKTEACSENRPENRFSELIKEYARFSWEKYRLLKEA